MPPAPAGGALAPAAVTEPITEDDERLAADADRSRAELMLRDSFAHGRLDLDELTRRVGEVHQAQTDRAGPRRAPGPAAGLLTARRRHPVLCYRACRRDPANRA